MSGKEAPFRSSPNLSRNGGEGCPERPYKIKIVKYK